MGEYAQASLGFWMAKGIPAGPTSNYLDHKGRNEIRASCLVCGKGVRHVNGDVEESLNAHYHANPFSHRNRHMKGKRNESNTTHTQRASNSAKG